MTTPHPSGPCATIRRFFGRLRADNRGNIAMLLGLSIIPLTFAIGFGIDYSRAEKLHTKLNAAADAAALAAVDPAMILRSNSDASAAATSMFNAQVSGLPGIASVSVTPTIVDGTANSSGVLGFLRKATVTYTAQTQNLFGGILGRPTMTINGSSAATAQQPPNVNFYVAMDNSPSMLLPATSSGLSSITSATTTSHLSDGCDFACHEQLPHTDNIYINDTSNRQVLLSTSFYTSGAANQNVSYRWDTGTNSLYDSSGNPMNSSSSSVVGPTTTTTGSGSTLKTVVTTVTTVTAVTYSITDSTTGPVTIRRTSGSTPTTVKVTTQNGSTTTTTTVGSTTTSASTFDTGYWADGYWLTRNYGQLYGTPSAITLRRDDVVSAVSQLIPFATNQASAYHVAYQMQMFSFDWTHPSRSTPVNTLNSMADVSTYGSNYSVSSLFSTDDYWYKNSMPTSGSNIDDKGTEFTNTLTSMNGIMATPGTGAAGSTPQEILFLLTDGMGDQTTSGSRWHGPLNSADLAACTAIKGRGIKIAILYTQYLPQALIGDSWSQSNIAPYLPPPPSGFPAGNAGSSDQVLTALQSCASPGTNGLPLVQTVTTDQDITAALQQLFSTALQAARLVQ